MSIKTLKNKWIKDREDSWKIYLIEQVERIIKKLECKPVKQLKGDLNEQTTSSTNR